MGVTWSDSQYENYEQRICSQWNAAIRERDSILYSKSMDKFIHPIFYQSYNFCIT